MVQYEDYYTSCEMKGATPSGTVGPDAALKYEKLPSIFFIYFHTQYKYYRTASIVWGPTLEHFLCHLRAAYLEGPVLMAMLLQVYLLVILFIYLLIL